MANNELFGNSEQLESSHFADPGNMVGDLISRQAALEAMDTWDKFGCDPDGKLVRYDDDSHYVPYVHYDDMVHAIKHLPSAQPTDEDIQRMQDIEQAMLEKAYWFGKQDAQQWIPRSKRLPKVREWVLCQCRAGIMDVLRLTEDNGWYKDSTHTYMHSFVLAWCPLPEPWKGEQE